MRRLREELEAENEQVSILPAIRRLGRAEDMRNRLKKETIGASSVTFAVLGETTFARLCMRGLRLLGRCYDVEAFEGDRPDAFCSSRRAESHCPTVAPRCSPCEEEHKTPEHKCPVEGCRVMKGRSGAHGVAKRRNCSGPDLAHNRGGASRPDLSHHTDGGVLPHCWRPHHRVLRR